MERNEWESLFELICILLNIIFFFIYIKKTTWTYFSIFEFKYFDSVSKKD